MNSEIFARNDTVLITQKWLYSFILMALFCILFTGCEASNSNSANSENRSSEITNNLNAEEVADVDKSDTEQANESETAGLKDVPVLKGPNIFNLIKAKLKDSPEMTAKDLTAYGNELIKQYGLNFALDLRNGTEVKRDNKDTDSSEFHSPRFINYDFTLSDNNKKTFHILNPVQDHPCGTVLDLPVTKITEKTMTLVVQENGKKSEQTIQRNKDFIIDEVHLIDEKNKKVVRKWYYPMDSYLAGISADGQKIYMNNWQISADDNDVNSENSIRIAIEISSDGIIKFVDAKEIPSSPGELLDWQTETSKQTGYGQFFKFKVGGNEYILFYEVPCT